MKQLILNQLIKNQDLKYRTFHSKIVACSGKTIGVRVPILRQIAKQIGDEYLTIEKMDFYEEKVIFGYCLAYSKKNFNQKKPYLDKFIALIDNWALCDTVCAIFKINSKEANLYYNYLISILKKPSEFEKRFAIVMFLSHFLGKNDDILMKKINQNLSADYYVQMAFAWLMATVYVYDQKSVINILQNSVNRTVIKMTLQKIRDSKRVRIEDKKDIIRLLSSEN